MTQGKAREARSSSGFRTPMRIRRSRPKTARCCEGRRPRGVSKPRRPKMLYEETLQTPTGAFRIITDEAGRVRRAGWEDIERTSERGVAPPAPSAAVKAFAAYFAGDVSAL